MARTYTGNLVTVEPVKETYAVGEYAYLHIVGEATMRNAVGAAFTWHTKYEVYDEANKFLAHDTRYHSVAPWTEVDTARDDFNIHVGRQVEGGLRGTVKMTAGG